MRKGKPRKEGNYVGVQVRMKANGNGMLFSGSKVWMRKLRIWRGFINSIARSLGEELRLICTSNCFKGKLFSVL